MSRLPYQEGTWFGVPLDGGGLSIGVAARIDGRGGIVGYFFGPRRESTPPLVEVEGFEASGSILVTQLGDLHLIEGKWPIIGRPERWSRDEWPIPAFCRQDPILEAVAWRVEYSEGQLNRPVREERISPEECSRLPKDGILGARAVERLLSHLISGAESGGSGER